MRLLSASFAQELPAKMSEIEALWSKLRIEGDMKTLQELHRFVHNLISNGEALGYPELGVEARELEQLLKSLIQKDILLDTAQSDEILQHINELKKILVEQEFGLTKNTTPAVLDKSALLAGTHASNSIFVVEEDTEAAQELALQLRYYGYEVEVFNRLDDRFRTAVQHKPDVIILMGVEFADDQMGGIHMMEDIQRELVRPARVIYISVHDEMSFRLGAVRAGSIAYFTKPINSTELIDRLDQITASQIQEPFRILIVNDNPTILAYYTAILEQAEMLVKTISEPMKLLEILSDFNPDLILMDLYMPGCSGIELTRVIRQMDNFLSIPIVYIATKNDFNTQSEAMSLRGDDFLIEPIDSTHLVAVVTSRVTRARSLRSLMHCGLTGLLNHTAIKEELSREIARSSRLNSSLSFAVLDIDYFKKINNTYGHAAGDRVIKSLARLLKQRLRETDVIGRYGGEEFAVIMNDTDAMSAAKVIDEIRNVFSRLLHLSYYEEFAVNFSAGIADLAHFPDAARLSEAADKALSQAKQRGRNRVVVNTGD